MKHVVTHVGPWRVERPLGRDLCGTYYAGCRDDGERATLYLLSDELAATGDEPLTRLIGLHRDIGHPGLVPFRGLDRDGRRRYLIAGAVDDALASLHTSRRPDPGQTRAVGAALAATLAAAHAHGLVHGGLELDNTLWAPDRAPQILGMGVAALGLADRVAIARSDVVALGRLLCTLVASWQTRGADRNTAELARLIADPGAAISMREAHSQLATLLAAGNQTQIACSPGGTAAPPTTGGRDPRTPDAREVRTTNGTARTEDHRPNGRHAGAFGPDAAPRPDHPGGYLGRYRILNRLGRGGMGEVLLAEDPVLRRGVAIKRIRPDLKSDRAVQARLRREAQLAAHLSHRAIVQVFDLVTDDNVDHVIMEYVPGPSLHTLLAGRAMAIAEVLRIAAELADGLAYAHQQGIIHRDLKLENILISTDGQPKIADFGIARRAAAAGHRAAQAPLTGEGLVLGTTRAMSPEQAQGQDVDARSDLFSFGVMLYELVTGRSPFAADSALATIARVLYERQPPAIALVPELPRALSDLIDHLLEKTSAERPDSARTVCDRLRGILDGPPLPHGVPRSEPPPPFELTAGLYPTDTPVAPPARGERPTTPPAEMPAARRFAGAPAATTSGSGEHDHPMMARDHEIQLLLGSWRRACQGHGQVAVLIGAPGIGKSRLARELTAAVAGDEPRQIVLRGSSHRQRSALDPVADAVAALLGLDTGVQNDPAGALVAVTDRIRALTGAGEAEQILHLLGCLTNPPSAPPDRARHQLLHGLRDVLVGSSHQVPTLLLVEDLHWLDPSTLDLIALLIQDVASSPMFLLMTTRPGLQPPWPASATITQYRLDRLDAAAINAVIAHACGDRALPAAERALIATRSEGVPLYAQELVRAALELGRAGEVPSTLRDALTARLHQLGPAATRVAHVAAVAGREFTADLVARASGLDRATVDHELDRLVAVEILLRRRCVAHELLHQFSHVLLQQAAYEELLAGGRRQLHGALADALLADERAGRDPGPELVAYHLAGAHRLAEAIASAQRAALRVLGRHARVEARALFGQALTWLEQLPESEERDRTEIGLRMQLGAVLLSTEGYTSPELERSSRRAEVLCERRDDVPLPVKFGLFAVRFMRGSHTEAEPLVTWFERVIAQDAPPVERMMAHVAIGTYACAHADYDLARHHLERAMALFVPAEHANVVRVYGGCGGFYGHVVNTAVLWQTGRFADAWRHARDMLAQVEALDPYTVATAVNWEMHLHIAVGDIARAEASAERALELSTRYQFRYRHCWARCGRGWALARRGQAERALAELVAANEEIKQIGTKVFYPYTLSLLAESAIAVGRFDHAERALDEALEVCRTSIDRRSEPELLRLRGQLILARDASAHLPARAAFADALAVAQRHGALAPALRAATDLALLLREGHLPHEAMAVLGPVYRSFAPDLDDPNLAVARQLLAELPAAAG